MGNLCVTPCCCCEPKGKAENKNQSAKPEDETEPKGQAENKNESAKPEGETEPAEEPTESMPMPPNPKGVLFTFKAPEPEKLVFHKNKKDEVLDPQTDPKTISK